MRRTVVWSVAIVLVAMLFADLFVLVLTDWVRSLPRESFAVDSRAWWTRRVAIACNEGFMMGMFTSQLLLAAAYTALGDGPSSKRTLYTTFVFAVFTNALVVFGMVWFQMAWSKTVFPFLIATLFFFVFQIPMWGIRSSLGWTIKSPWSESVPRRPLRFSLAHMLGWSTFLAVPLCIFRTLTMTGSQGHIPYIFWIWGLILCALQLWFVYLVLATNLNKWQFAAAAVLSLLLAIAMQCAVFWHLGGSTDFVTVLAIFSGNSCGGAVMLFCLCLAHRLGFRLLPFDTKR